MNWIPYNKPWWPDFACSDLNKVGTLVKLQSGSELLIGDMDEDGFHSGEYHIDFEEIVESYCVIWRKDDP